MMTSCQWKMQREVNRLRFLNFKQGIVPSSSLFCNFDQARFATSLRIFTFFSTFAFFIIHSNKVILMEQNSENQTKQDEHEVRKSPRKRKIKYFNGHVPKVVAPFGQLICTECTNNYCYIKIDSKTFPQQISLKKGPDSMQYMKVERDDPKLKGTRYWEGIEDWVYGKELGLSEYYQGTSEQKYKQKQKKKSRKKEESPTK